KNRPCGGFLFHGCSDNLSSGASTVFSGGTGTTLTEHVSVELAESKSQSSICDFPCGLVFGKTKNPDV
ncbi:TPA: hypothetical protein ACJIPV_005732, partial [Pseudomonas aeruginosa]